MECIVIYIGIGAILVIYFLTPFKDNIAILFIISFIITSILELITGFLLEKIFKYKWWNYSNLPFNVRGYICLKFSIIWGIICIFLLNIISPLVEEFILWMNIYCFDCHVGRFFNNYSKCFTY